MAKELKYCQCGAVTLTEFETAMVIRSASTQREIAISQETLDPSWQQALDKVKPHLDSPELVNCNHCVNDWSHDDDPECVAEVTDFICSLYWTLRF